MTTTINQRGFAASAALAACFTVLSFRLVHLQVTDHAYYEAKAANQNLHTEPIYARRGEILDVHGIPLAQNEPVKTIVADGSLIKDLDGLAKLLAQPLDMPAQAIRAKLARRVKSKLTGGTVPVRYIVLKKGVPEVVANEIARLVGDVVVTPKKEGLVHAKEAVRFEQDFVRVYPNATSLCHVLGFVNDAGVGVDGVEASMNEHLRGHDGQRYVEHDRTGRELVLYRGQEEPRKDGRTELDSVVRKTRPKKATIVMMNPKTGEIMAMANRPNFNPNSVPKIPKGAVDVTRNIAITDQFEPGSTFKIVPVAAALSEKLVGLDTGISTENGYWQWCKLNDTHPYASLTVRDILIKSSNIGAAKLGIQLGDQKFYEYARKFGFGDTLSVQLPGEIRGSVLPPGAWDKITITRMPMGQSVAATPLQITNAMCAIANGGTLMTPQIIRDVVSDGGTSEYKPQEKWRTVSKRSTEQVREALVKVVGPKGTAALAQVPGFKVAGKTGTAQKVDENGRMSHEKYVLSFIGFMPADDPAFVMLVLLDEPRVERELNYGGKTAAPIFARIAEKAARYLNLEPTEPIPLTDAAIAMASKAAKGKPKSKLRNER
jgi:cell division protein FtsI/penicillin-binding protein 2